MVCIILCNVFSVKSIEYMRRSLFICGGNSKLLVLCAFELVASARQSLFAKREVVTRLNNW